VTFANILAQGAGAASDYVLNGYTMDTTVTNLSKDASSPNNALDSLTVTFAGGDDFALNVSDTLAKNAGTDVSGYGIFAGTSLATSKDINGNTRAGSWDIGAAELAGYTPPVLPFTYVSFRGA
jgi:hypothetical protein